MGLPASVHSVSSDVMMKMMMKIRPMISVPVLIKTQMIQSLIRAAKRQIIKKLISIFMLTS